MQLRSNSNGVRTIAFYLPQYHPIPENDEWWGAGFTEWTNVAKANKMYPTHFQPRVPADLGFYDLRLAESREAQANLAKKYGIDAFCYYHYWFSGRRIIEKPFNEVLNSGEPDHKFCLCWANQTWSGIWHGAENRTLIEQKYFGDDDCKSHFDYLLKAFSDMRYLKDEFGRPIFVVYRPKEIPNSVEFFSLWRRLAIEAGLPGLYLVGETNEPDWDPKSCGLDASVVVLLPPKRRGWVPWTSPIKKLVGLFYDFLGLPTIYSYKNLINKLVAGKVDGITSFPCVIPNWDNTPRSGSKGLVFHGSTPELFRIHLLNALERLSQNNDSDKILFVKSWNEWAEGNYLEPDLKFGLRYLEVIRQVFSR